MRNKRITQKMLLHCIERESCASLQDRKDSRRFSRGPLWAWMRGVPNSSKSKVMAVAGNNCRWSWNSWNRCGIILHERLSKRYGLTWIQKQYLWAYINRKYPGRYDRKERFEYQNGCTKYSNLANASAFETHTFIKQMVHKTFPDDNPPLRLILSPEFATLINLKFLEIFL